MLTGVLSQDLRLARDRMRVEQRAALSPTSRTHSLCEQEQEPAHQCPYWEMTTFPQSPGGLDGLGHKNTPSTVPGVNWHLNAKTREENEHEVILKYSLGFF